MFLNKKHDSRMDEVVELSQPLQSIHDPETAASSHDDKMLEEETPKKVYLPINIVNRIFGFLDVDTLEIARRVCRTWNNVIETHRSSLPYREVQVLHLSTNCEFVFALFANNKVYRYTTQKFWTDFDTEPREKTRLHVATGKIKYCFHCRDSHASTKPWLEHHNTSRTHIHRCTVRASFGAPTPLSSCAIYNVSKRDFYAKQLFTPPLAFYEKLRDMTMYTNIRTVVLNHFSVNETTGDMLKRWRGTLRVDRCCLHNVNLRAVSPKEFHYLITEAIVADEYDFAYIHKALPDHFNAQLFFHPTMLFARSILIGAIFDRTEFKNMVRCNFPEEDLHKFIYRPGAGVLDTFHFNRDNFPHSDSLLHRLPNSIFQTVQSKRDDAVV